MRGAACGLVEVIRVENVTKRRIFMLVSKVAFSSFFFLLCAQNQAERGTRGPCHLDTAGRPLLFFWKCLFCFPFTEKSSAKNGGVVWLFDWRVPWFCRFLLVVLLHGMTNTPEPLSVWPSVWRLLRMFGSCEFRVRRIWKMPAVKHKSSVSKKANYVRVTTNTAGYGPQRSHGDGSGPNLRLLRKERTGWRFWHTHFALPKQKRLPGRAARKADRTERVPQAERRLRWWTACPAVCWRTARLRWLASRGSWSARSARWRSETRPGWSAATPKPTKILASFPMQFFKCFDVALISIWTSVCCSCWTSIAVLKVNCLWHWHLFFDGILYKAVTAVSHVVLVEATSREAGKALLARSQPFPGDNWCSQLADWQYTWVLHSDLKTWKCTYICDGFRYGHDLHAESGKMPVLGVFVCMRSGIEWHACLLIGGDFTLSNNLLSGVTCFLFQTLAISISRDGWTGLPLYPRYVYVDL